MLVSCGRLRLRFLSESQGNLCKNCCEIPSSGGEKESNRKLIPKQLRKEKTQQSTKEKEEEENLKNCEFSSKF